MQPEHVLVVGAGLAGLRTAEQLRAAGHQGRISLVGAETHAPYDRPPLSKQVLTGDWEPAKTVLRDLDALDELGVRVHLGTAAVALRHGERGSIELELSDGSSLHGDAVVVATGVTARRLPGQPDSAHVLRTLDDSLALREVLGAVSSLLVVGGGFIGAEVASAAVGRGIAVTVLEAASVPAERALGPVLGALAARLMTEAGVDLRTGTSLTGFVDGGVVLADGTELTADAVLVGVGSAPQVAWLPATGPDGHALDLANGVPCGPTGRVHGLPGVWAVGDVAAWDGRRTEHWTSAGDQAAAVAHDILGVDPPPATVPYFWSDQFGLKIQLVGHPDGADEVLPLLGAGLDGGPVRGTVAGYLAGDRLVAVAGFGAARHLARYRALVADGADRRAALDLAAAQSAPRP
ncbi:NAD(P)/FAD-dependent oxidoreductase [Pseudonocardia broussonetiae]|uniref:FAD-dependent oxidoreductase n=1 Tax=Pseudonocardia broussonetiae TaxID=2736640 RepID=A0A6M6JE68_9PSEU|nr:FAD-dependent oxidoreductase [Pseudonocardia broussonetiae]QJY44709.1 FAD-dependent oxidoreductase [Pseudonocardia broussonetiae]